MDNLDYSELVVVDVDGGSNYVVHLNLRWKVDLARKRSSLIPGRRHLAEESHDHLTSIQVKPAVAVAMCVTSIAMPARHVGGDRRAGVEAEPADPQQRGAYHGL